MVTPRKRQAVKIPATSPEARDAGPRLIPQQIEAMKPGPGMEYHLELADIALGVKKSPKRTRLSKLPGR